MREERNAEGQHLGVTPAKRPRQPDIRAAITESAFEGYLKLMKTAYEMALVPSMSSTSMSF